MMAGVWWLAAVEQEKGGSGSFWVKRLAGMSRGRPDLSNKCWFIFRVGRKIFRWPEKSPESGAHTNKQTPSKTYFQTLLIPPNHKQTSTHYQINQNPPPPTMVVVVPRLSNQTQPKQQHTTRVLSKNQHKTFWKTKPKSNLRKHRN